MLNLILPEPISSAINQISSKMLNEIRLRNNKPIQICANGKNFYLNQYGITNSFDSAIKCEQGYINYILGKVSNNSLYSINNQIVNGYISFDGGIRIGVAGEVVYENNLVKTIKNISSLDIRIPHEVKNCSLNCYPLIVENNIVKSTLVLSNPGSGKTTFIKDLVYQIGKRNPDINILVADERGEISNVNLSEIANVDIYVNCTKKFAFENGIRSLKPNVIVTDEINLDNDLEVIKNALTCGVKVVATIHAGNIYDLKQKRNFIEILNAKMFERFVVLNSSCGPGTLEGIYNQNLNCIYC